MIELVGTSADSFDDAVKNAIAEAQKTVHGIRWFQVSDLRGAIGDGAVQQFQVTVKIGFKVERSA